MVWLWLTWLALTRAWVLSIFYSMSSPIALRQTLVSDLEVCLALRPVTVSVTELTPDQSLDGLLDSPSNLVLDATFDSLLGILLKDQAIHLNLPILTLSSDTNHNVHISSLELAEGIRTLLERFKWKSISLLTEPGKGGIEIASFLRSGQTLLNVYEVPKDASFNMTVGLVAKEIKVWSSPVLVCTAAPQTCSLLLQAAKQANMIKEGYAFILIHPPGVLQVPAVPGLLHVLEKGSEAAQSVSEYHALRVAYWINHLLNSQGATVTLTQVSDADLRTAQVWN